MDQESSQTSGLARGQIQQRIDRIESQLRRRIKGKLLAAGRGYYDIDDVLSSVRRRVDQAAVEGNLTLQTDHELEGYIVRVAHRVALAVVRKELRRESLGRYRFSKPLTERENASFETEEAVAGIMRRLPMDDRHRLELRAKGLSHERIADLTDSSLAAHQSRWRRLLTRLRQAAVALRDGL